MTKQCDACKWARNYPAPPAEAPKMPERPAGRWAGFWWDEEGASWDHDFAMAAYRDKVRNHEEWVRCHRMPETIVKRKTDFCGEYAK